MTEQQAFREKLVSFILSKVNRFNNKNITETVELVIINCDT